MAITLPLRWSSPRSSRENLAVVESHGAFCQRTERAAQRQHFYVVITVCRDETPARGRSRQRARGGTNERSLQDRGTVLSRVPRPALRRFPAALRPGLVEPALQAKVHRIAVSPSSRCASALGLRAPLALAESRHST